MARLPKIISRKGRYLFHNDSDPQSHFFPEIRLPLLKLCLFEALSQKYLFFSINLEYSHPFPRLFIFGA